MRTEEKITTPKHSYSRGGLSSFNPVGGEVRCPSPLLSVSVIFMYVEKTNFLRVHIEFFQFHK